MKNTNNLLTELATAAKQDTEKIIKKFVKKNKISPERGKKILKKFLKDTKPIAKQAAKMAKENVSGRVKQARGILRLLDKSLGLLERSLRKIK